MLERTKITLVCLLLVFSYSFYSQTCNIKPHNDIIKKKFQRSLRISKNDNHSKAVAAGFNITLGMFGVHRIYLGTSPKVPVIYTFTLGGCGLLLLSDLGCILFTKDLEKYAYNDEVFMW